MTRRSFSKCCWAGCVALSLLSGVACSESAADDEVGNATHEAETGSLTLALSADVGDHTYQFSRFEVLIYPEYLWLSSYGGPERALTAQLSTGRHQAYLYDWALERDDGSGTFAHVDANLTSSPWVDFEILNGSTTSVAYQFETDGEIVRMGSGSLNVEGEVTERAPVCTVLGTDCGMGAWCPPTGLTGAPLACRSEGAAALGAACSAPADCVANSTCLDAGAGAICTALCGPESFDQDCESGGHCTPVANDYGVCLP